MNKVEVFKNELRNYHFYKSEYKRLEHIYQEESKLLKEDDCLDRYRLLREFHKPLIDIEKELDGVFTQLTGFHAIRYDKEPCHISEELAMEIKLDLIDKYHEQLTKFMVNLQYAEENLIEEMNRLSKNINKIEKVLKQMPEDIANVCVGVYCKGKKYEDIVNNSSLYWSASGIYWNINKELERVLNGMDK